MSQPAPTRPSRLITIALVIVMLASLVFALAYLTTSASDLPPFLPRHQGGIARHHRNTALQQVHWRSSLASWPTSVWARRTTPIDL